MRRAARPPPRTRLAMSSGGDAAAAGPRAGIGQSAVVRRAAASEGSSVRTDGSHTPASPHTGQFIRAREEARKKRQIRAFLDRMRVLDMLEPAQKDKLVDVVQTVDASARRPPPAASTPRPGPDPAPVRAQSAETTRFGRGRMAKSSSCWRAARWTSFAKTRARTAARASTSRSPACQRALSSVCLPFRPARRPVARPHWRHGPPAGEAALLTNEPRNASAIVHSEKAKFYCIARKSLLDVLGQEGQKRVRCVCAPPCPLRPPRRALTTPAPRRGARQAVIYRSILAGIPMFRVRACAALALALPRSHAQGRRSRTRRSRTRSGRR